MSALQAILFDVDGTLADTERDGHRVAFERAFAEAGLDWRWDPEHYGRLLAVTGGKERIRHHAELIGATLDDAAVRALHAAKTRHYVAMLADGAIGLRVGVEPLLAEARAAGVRLAIATTTTPENVTALLAATLGPEAIAWFEVIGAGDVVPVKKPAPDIYTHVLDALGLSAGDCLAVEDSANGVRSACAAALATLVTANGYTARDDFAGASLVVDGFGSPEVPFSVLAGDAHGHAHVTLDLLRAVHAAA